MTSPIPDDTMRTRVALIVAISVVGVAILAMGAWAVFRPHPKPPAKPTYSPITETTASATPTTGSVDASGAPSAESSTTTAVPPAESGTAASPAFVRASKIAFRLGSTVYVADEDGGSARAVVQAADGPFALSPDGRALALTRAGNVTVYDVETGLPSFSGPAESVQPEWLPDSSAVMFMRVGADGVPQMFRVSSTGGPETLVGTGSGSVSSPDGAILALLPAPGSTATPQVLVSKNGGAFQTVDVPSGDPIEVTLSNSRLFVSTISTSSGAAVWSFALDGSDRKQLVKPSSAAEKGSTFGRLLLSPDGASLLYAEESDDGYSRMWLVPVAGGTPVSLSPRRDSYPLKWSVSGKEILFIEGNAFQGESTALFHVSPAGTRRLMVVSGAGL